MLAQARGVFVRVVVLVDPAARGEPEFFGERVVTRQPPQRRDPRGGIFRGRDEAASLLCALAIADDETEPSPLKVAPEAPTRKRSRSDVRSIPGGCACPCGCARELTPGGPYYDFSTRQEICNSCRTTQGRARLFYTRGAAANLSDASVAQRKRCTTKPCWTGQSNGARQGLT